MTVWLYTYLKRIAKFLPNILGKQIHMYMTNYPLTNITIEKPSEPHLPRIIPLLYVTGNEYMFHFQKLI